MGDSKAVISKQTQQAHGLDEGRLNVGKPWDLPVEMPPREIPTP